MSETVADLNAATEASVAARTAAIASAPSKAKTAKRTPKVKTPVVAPKSSGRAALTPSERAKRPVTSTIASYVEWLDRTVYAGKMTAAQKSAAGISITLYGNYQSSPERKAARGY
jgi:hypothetical protein